MLSKHKLSVQSICFSGSARCYYWGKVVRSNESGIEETIYQTDPFKTQKEAADFLISWAKNNGIATYFGPVVSGMIENNLPKP